MKKIVQDATIRLLKKDEFFANLLFQMDKVYTDQIDTLGVGFRNNKLTLYISPKFLEGKSLEFQEQVLVHECEHVIKGHLLEYRNKGYNLKLYNIATDIQINENLKELHEIGMTCDKFGFEKNLISDQYYELLKKQQEENKDDNGEGKGEQIGDHDKWGEASDEVIQGEIQGAIEKAIQETKNKGNVPNSALETIEMLKKRGEISWRKQLRRFVGKRASIEQRTTRMRKNKRYGYLYAGVKTENNKLNISVCLDTSASVSNTQLQEFFKEIGTLNNEGHDITIIECDADVHRVEKYKKSSTFKVTGRGGTAYQPALDKSRELQSDLILFFGDGGYFDTPVDPKIPLIWILGKNDKINVDFGTKINLSE